MTAATAWYPLAPLAAAIGEPLQSIGRLLNLSGSSWNKVRDRGVTEKTAERYAVRLGVHPYVVWPEMLDHVTAALSKACPECGGPFLPVNGNQKYCNTRCTSRVSARMHKRRKYRRDAAFREEQKAASKVYRAENARAVKIKAKAYRDRTSEERLAAARARYAANRDDQLRKQRIRDHYRRGHEERGCPAGCPLFAASRAEAA